MKWIIEDDLTQFDFWAGAKERAELLTDTELHTVSNVLEDMYPQGIDQMQVNNLFWFDFETVLSWLGYEVDTDADDYGLSKARKAKETA